MRNAMAFRVGIAAPITARVRPYGGNRMRRA